MKPVQTLSTPRFSLRPLRREDAAALFPTLSDEGQCRYLLQGAFESEEALWAWLADPTWDGRTWIAEDKATGEVAARFVAVPTDLEGCQEEIGYITCKQRQRDGVARECMEVLIPHLLGEEGTTRLLAGVDPENTASVVLLQRLGFTHLRTDKGTCTTHIGVRDEGWYILSS